MKKPKNQVSTKDLQPEPVPTPLYFKPIHQDTLTLNYRKLKEIPLAQNPSLIKHLHLSHNNLASLVGVELFPFLESLNVSHNELSEITELNLIQNKDKLKRIGLKRNKFEFGYQNAAVTMLKGLTWMDSKEFKEQDKKVIEGMANDISERIVGACAAAERLISFMQGIVDNIGLKVQLSQRSTAMYSEEERYKDGFLSLLYQNIPEQIAIQLHSIVALNKSNLQNLSIRSHLALQQQIINLLFESDIKCTCRPVNVKKQLFQSFSYIFDKLMLHFSNKFDKHLKNTLDKRIAKRQEIDQNRFKQDSQYSKICLLFQFYMMAPNKSKFQQYPGKYIQIQNPLLLEQRSALFPNHYKYGVPHGQLKTVNEDLHIYRMKDITNLYKYEAKKLRDKDILKETISSEKAYLQPDYIYDQFTQRIPIFEYSNHYPEIISTILLQYVFKIVNLHDRICSHRHSYRIGMEQTFNKFEAQNSSFSSNMDQRKTDNLPTTKPSKTFIESKSRADSQNDPPLKIQRQKTIKKNEDDFQQNIENIQQQQINTFSESNQRPKEQPFTAQQIYEISLKYKVFQALAVNTKRRKTLVR